MSIDIQQMCGNGASASGSSGVQSPVKTWNKIGPDANGNINATADDIGAALASINVRTVTKAYMRYMSIEGHEETTPMGFLWARGKGSYFLRTEDGIHFVSCVDAASGMKARLYVHIPSPQEEEHEQEPEQEGENGSLLLGAEGEPAEPHIKGGIYLNSLQLAGISSTADLAQLFFSINNSPIATAADIETALTNYVTDQQLTNALMGKVTPTGARNIARDEFIRTLPLTAVGSTYLEKIKEDGKTLIKVNFGCADWLYANWNQFESVNLILYICHRRHGLKYRWRHPLNWNEDSENPELNRYGYGMIAGMTRDEQHYPDEVFPAIPRWMPDNGYMRTVIPLKKTDAKLGYYLIDPGFYFLCMLKPADCTQPFTRKNIEFLGTQPRTNTARRHLPAMVTWGIEADGKPLGKPMNTLRVGLRRDDEMTQIANDSYQRPGRAYLADPYLKID